jgi:hypothetical protein
MKIHCIAAAVFIARAAVAPAGELCLVPSAANNRNLTVACGGTGYPNAQLGYGTDGEASCNVATPKDCEFFNAGDILWTVSASATDPWVNSGALPAQSSLYLWLNCMNTPNGMAAAEFDLEGHGLEIVGLTPMNGFLYGGGATKPVLAVAGCPGGSALPVLAARIDVAASVGVERNSWGRIKGTYR